MGPGVEQNDDIQFSEPGRRWTAKRRVALVVSILKGETSRGRAAPPASLTVAEVELARESFAQCGECAAEPATRRRPWKDEPDQEAETEMGIVLDSDILQGRP